MTELQIKTIQNHLFTVADWNWILGGKEEQFTPPQLTKQGLQQYNNAFAAFADQEYADALPSLETLFKQNHNNESVAYAYALCCVAEATENCGEVLEKVLAPYPKSAAYHYLKGMWQEREGDWFTAMQSYEAAIEENENFIPAMFRLAYLADLRGDEEYALQLYQQCVEIFPHYANPWINMGLLYEDDGEYYQALDSYMQVMDKVPEDRQARLYHKDARSSLSMYVDEDKERESNKLSEILATPITDFELSVRSKNCLNKMKIKTLGDLIKKTETELLSYKNFGETSLAEIKGILEKKGLKLGMGIEEKVIGKKKEKKNNKTIAATIPPNQEVLEIPISTLELSVRSRKCLTTMNINIIGELIQKKESELLSCRNFGQTSLLEIKRKLAELGVALQEDS